MDEFGDAVKDYILVHDRREAAAAWRNNDALAVMLVFQLAHIGLH